MQTLSRRDVIRLLQDGWARFFPKRYYTHTPPPNHILIALNNPRAPINPMLPPTLSNTPPVSERFTQRLRVREMLRGVRQHQLRQLSTPLEHTSDVASVLQTGITAASASAFGDPLPGYARSSSSRSSGGAESQIGGGAFSDGSLASSTISTTSPFTGSSAAASASDIAIMVLSVVAITLVFVVVGQCIDTLLGVTAPSCVGHQASIPTHTPHKHHGDDETVDDPYGILVAKTIGQMVLNVTLLMAPYVILAKYAPHTLVFQYYVIVAAFWVVSLHAQEQLRNRFSRVLEGDDARVAAEKKATSHRNATLLAEHVEQAKQAQQRAQQTPSNQTQDVSIHHPTQNAHGAPSQLNPVPLPATQTSHAPSTGSARSSYDYTPRPSGSYGTQSSGASLYDSFGGSSGLSDQDPFHSTVPI